MQNKTVSWSIYAIIILAILVFANYNSSLGLLMLFLIALIAMQSAIGDLAILCFLAIRPALDYWRDYNLINVQFFNSNINGAISILLLVWSIVFLVRNKKYWSQIPLKTPWFLFLAWCAVSGFYSFDFPATVTEVLRATNLFSLFAVAYVLRLKSGPKFYKNTLLALTISAIFPISLAIYQLFANAGVRIDEVNNRIFGTFAHPNVLSTYALLLIMVATDGFVRYEQSFKKILKLIPNKKDFTQLVYCLIMAFCALVVIFTYTRISWIGLAIFFIIILLVFSRRILLYGIIIIALFYTLFYPLNSYLIRSYNINLQNNSFLARLTARNSEADSIGWRAELIGNIIPLYRQRPIVGYGYGAFAKVWDDNKDSQYLYDSANEAHNDYVKAAFEIGIIGLVLFLAIFASLFWNQIKFGFKNNWKNIVFIASIAVYIVLSLTYNMTHHTPTIWWLSFVWGIWSAEQHGLTRRE
jgi:O-antigen ligase